LVNRVKFPNLTVIHITQRQEFSSSENLSLWNYSCSLSLKSSLQFIENGYVELLKHEQQIILYTSISQYFKTSHYALCEDLTERERLSNIDESLVAHNETVVILMLCINPLSAMHTQNSTHSVALPDLLHRFHLYHCVKGKGNSRRFIYQKNGWRIVIRVDFVLLSSRTPSIKNNTVCAESFATVPSRLSGLQ